MAYIRPHKNGHRAEVARHGMRASYVAPTKREATAWAIRKEAEFDALKGSGGTTFHGAVTHYLATVSTRKEGVEWERRRFAAFTQYFGADTPLAKIDSDLIGKWRDFRLNGDEHQKPVCGSTVQRDANLLRNLFTVAKDEWKWITDNPFRGVRLPESNPPRHQVWTWQLIKRVLRADRDGKTSEMILAFRLALHTGLRLSEVLGAVYDPRRNIMVLTKTKTTKRGTLVEVPIVKRAVKLFPQTFTVGPNEGSVLFSSLCKELLISDLTFHDSRASALTWLSRKMDVMTLARISRHKDINILMNTYYRETAEQISRRL